MSEPDERVAPVGPHLVHFKGDTVFVTVRGVMTGGHMQELLKHFADVNRENGALFVLYDSSQCTSVEADARKFASTGRSDDNSADLRVVFGISFTMRVLLTMVLRAQKALTNRDVTVYAFDKENEARTFFETEREKIRRAKRLKKSL